MQLVESENEHMHGWTDAAQEPPLGELCDELLQMTPGFHHDWLADVSFSKSIPAVPTPPDPPERFVSRRRQTQRFLIFSSLSVSNRIARAFETTNEILSR